MSIRKYSEVFPTTGDAPKPKQPRPENTINSSNVGIDRHANQTGNTSQQILWVNKYQPKELTEVVGNAAKISRLKDWLNNWHSQLQRRNSKAILISGPPGIGKTTSAKLVSAKLGYDCFEVNASDSRNKSNSVVSDGIKGNLISVVKEMVTNSPIAFNGQKKRMVLIMDEVDGMSSGDRGGVAELISLIKETKIPVICICNDKYSTKLKSLLPYCDECAFQRPLRPQLVKYITEVARKENLNITSDSLLTLVEACDNDVRLMLNQLQMLKIGTSSNYFSDKLIKDVPGNPFSNTDKLFDGAMKSTVQQRESQALSDDLIPLFVQENYVNIRPSIAQSEEKRLELLAASACRISDADIISKAVYVDQRWGLLPVATISSSVLPSSIVSGRREVLSVSQNERNFHRFPALLGKISSRSKVNRVCHELSSHFCCHAPCAATSSQVRLEYFPLVRTKTLRPMMFAAKGGRESEGIAEVVSFMREYNLNRTDWDTLHDVTKFNGKGLMFQSVASVLCGKVKSAFTRAYGKSLRFH